jgi:HEPN domain-containing protein
MRPDRTDVAKAWLKRARGNFARACQPKPAEGFWEDLCFDAQQAAEKAIKALMIARDLRFPHTHDIGKLLEQLMDDGLDIPAEVAAASSLTEFAVQSRYPGWGEPVTEGEYREALEAASRVIAWVEGRLHR